MKNTVLVELKNDNALNLLYDLEKMNIIQVVREPEPEKIYNSGKVDSIQKNEIIQKINIGERFAGVFTKEDSDSLKEHVKLSREEWDNHI